MPPDIAVFGTGALGSLLAARLSAAGAHVTVIGTWDEALAAVARDGVRIAGGAAYPAATARRGEPVTAALVIVAVKAYQTRLVAAAARAAVAPGGTLLSLQNGLGNAEDLQSPGLPLALGVTSAGATLAAPGVVRWAGAGETTLGWWAGEQPARALDTVAQLFDRAGLPTSVVADIAPWLWRKVAINVALNPLTALLGIPNGALPDRPEWALAAAAAREVAAVARAEGVLVPDDPVAAALAVARNTATNLSSMLQDVRHGRPTEIEALCGEVVRRGRARGVATPANAQLAARVRRREGRPEAA